MKHLLIAASIIASFGASAELIKFNSGDVLTATELNNNFKHVEQLATRSAETKYGDFVKTGHCTWDYGAHHLVTDDYSLQSVDYTITSPQRVESATSTIRNSASLGYGDTVATVNGYKVFTEANQTVRPLGESGGYATGKTFVEILPSYYLQVDLKDVDNGQTVGNNSNGIDWVMKEQMKGLANCLEVVTY